MDTVTTSISEANDGISSEACELFAGIPEEMFDENNPHLRDSFEQVRLEATVAAECDSWLRPGEPVQIIKGSLTGRQGTVVYVGHTFFARGKWVGIRLKQPLGFCNGTVQNIRYFVAAEKHGSFLRPHAVRPISTSKPICINSKTPDSLHPSKGSTRPEFCSEPLRARQILKKKKVPALKLPKRKTSRRNSDVSSNASSELIYNGHIDRKRFYLSSSLLQQAQSLSREIRSEDPEELETRAPEHLRNLTTDETDADVDNFLQAAIDLVENTKNLALSNKVKQSAASHPRPAGRTKRLNHVMQMRRFTRPTTSI